MPRKTKTEGKEKDAIAIKDVLLANHESALGMGDVARFVVTVNKKHLLEEGYNLDKIYLRIKNEENIMVRPVYLSGPFSLYCDVRPHNYNDQKKFHGDEDIAFCSDLKPRKTFKVLLLLNENSRVAGTDKYKWTIDILCQLALPTTPKVSYSIRLATNKKLTKKCGHHEKLKGFKIKRWDTMELWNLPPKYPEKPVHMVIITHGIFSNIGCDMLYMKDKIEEAANKVEEAYHPNIVVRGCMRNMGKSARGVHYLGCRVGKYILEEYDLLSKKYKVDKISFVGHSLGGPSETMAIHYITVTRPDFFNEKNGVKPVNLITLASPFLGVIGDFPRYATMALTMGALGITGRDLNLQNTMLVSKDGLYSSENKEHDYKDKKLLEIIPEGPAKKVFESFIHRTCYANVIHDGIVPLRTAALLYLDWQSLTKVKQMRRKIKHAKTPAEYQMNPSAELDSEDLTPVTSNDKRKSSVGEIPFEKLEKTATAQYMAPRGLGLFSSYKLRRFEISQTVENAESSSSGEFINEKKHKETEEYIDPPTNPSQIMSALQVLIAPEPTQKYIKDPKIRNDAIVHDKMYHPNELPPPYYQNRGSFKKVMYPKERANRVQENIARSWQGTMTWRKILVDLKPDSHNNISVRRRFTNLYGAVAVTHMAEEHFGKPAAKKYADI